MTFISPPTSDLAAHDGLRITVLAVPEMCCATEFGIVDAALRRHPGVRDVAADYIRRAVRVRHAAVQDNELLTAAAGTGFAVHLAPAALPRPRTRGTIAIRAVPSSPEMDRVMVAGATGAVEVTETTEVIGDAVASAAGREESGSQSETQLETAGGDRRISAGTLRLVAGGALAVLSELVSLTTGDDSAVVAGLAIGSILLAGLPTYRKGQRALRSFNLSITALMAIAVSGAMLIGQWPEAAMVMVLFSLAEMIESASLARAHRATEGLADAMPRTATVLRGGVWLEVPVLDVPLSATVRANPGERIALDGIVTAGTSAIDEAAVTGESMPVEKTVGDPVFAGTVNHNSELQYEVNVPAAQSTMARIARAVEEAQASRAPMQRHIDAFARWYTPLVFLAACCVAVLAPLVVDGQWSAWAYRALVLLVIACPCALVLSMPISIVSGLTAAARRGILVKGGAVLERGHRLRVLALDKTGTLTRGRLTVTDVQVLHGTRSEAVDLAWSLASRSSHPVSRAVALHFAADTSDTRAKAVAGFREVPGGGVEGEVAGQTVRLGNRRMVAMLSSVPPDLSDHIDRLEQQGKTVVVLLRDLVPLAVFALRDTVRPGSKAAIDELKRLGLQLVMLTGDNAYAAQVIARELDIDDVRAQLSPLDKLSAISKLCAESPGAVGMVGDGINDAPALARSDLGFAMGGVGTAVAIDTADVALLNDDLDKIAAFVSLSRATNTVLWQNIALALGLKAVFLTLAVAGHATLWMAVLADMGGSLLVVANGLRLLSKRLS